MKKKLSNYRRFVPESKISEIYRKGSRLNDYHMLHINSAYHGGGIAEILRNIVPLLNDIGVETGWRALIGTPDFFRVCKRFHNALSGDEINLTDMKKKVFEETNENFATFTHIDHDLIIVHNHLPLPLIVFYRKNQPWIWRCHDDLSNSNPKIMDYLKDFAIPYDRYVFQMGEYVFSGVDEEECSFIQPSIDPLSIKNRPMDEKEVNKNINSIGVDPSLPIVTQVSQFDKHKDPLGTIEVYEKVLEEVNCQLIMVGSVARHDPEGQNLMEKVSRRIRDLKNAFLVIDPSDTIINSVQRASNVVLQKSIKEGFGLAVSEALWKETPVVGSDVGGIPTQIVDGENGFLVDPNDYEEAAEKVLKLLSDGDLQEEMGRNGRERIRKKFLVTHQIEAWLNLWLEMLA